MTVRGATSEVVRGAEMRRMVSRKPDEVARQEAQSSQMPGLDALSPRELDVLRGVVYGHTNQEIADHLEISVKSVETYRTRCAEKVGSRSRVGLVQYALDTGLLRPGGAGLADRD